MIGMGKATPDSSINGNTCRNSPTGIYVGNDLLHQRRARFEIQLRKTSRKQASEKLATFEPAQEPTDKRGRCEAARIDKDECPYPLRMADGETSCRITSNGITNKD